MKSPGVKQKLEAKPGVPKPKLEAKPGAPKQKLEAKPGAAKRKAEAKPGAAKRKLAGKPLGARKSPAGAIPAPPRITKPLDQQPASRGTTPAESPAAAAQHAEKLNAAYDAIRAGLPAQARALFSSEPRGARRNRGLAFVRRVEAGEALIARICDPEVEAFVPEGDAKERRLTGILVAPRHRATTRAVILFGGNGDRHFPVIPKALLTDRSHLILIKDPSRCFTMCGVPRLGPNYDTNLARLRRILRRLGADEVYCIGFSSGGFSALKFGLDLGARGVLAFGTPTTLDINDDPGSDLKKYPQLTAIYRKARHLATSMATAYKTQLPHPAVTLVYGENHARDTFCASLMRGIPGVALDPLSAYGGHSTYTEAMLRGRIPALLTRLFESKPVTE